MPEPERNTTTNDGDEDDLSRLLDFGDEADQQGAKADAVPNSESAKPQEGERRTHTDPPVQRDIYDDMLDHDPALRQQVKEEMRRRLAGQSQQQQQGEPPKREPTRLELVSARIEELAQKKNEFLSLPEDQRTQESYIEFERMREEQFNLGREESRLIAQQSETEARAARAGEVVDQFLQQAIEQERRTFGSTTIDRFQGRVRELARSLDPEVRADPQRLRQTLEFYVLPNAKSEYLDQQRLARRNAPSQRRSAQDHAGGEAYMDGGDDSQKATDPYANASPDEREFLKGLGLIKDAPQEGRRALIPTRDGFIIPVTQGRKNNPGGQGGSQ